nr:MAG TPA: hypothetical protein [Caudoviricetes sp.]
MLTIIEIKHADLLKKVSNFAQWISLFQAIISKSFCF